MDILDYELETEYKRKQFVFKVKFNGDLSEIRLMEGAGFCFFDKSEIESYNALIPDMCKNSLKIFLGSFES